jgi:hypothetical protein
MKKILFSFAIFSALLLIGCKDNSMTDPVSSQPLNKANINQAEITQNVIPLDFKLTDPVTKNIDYKLIGDIDYTEEVVDRNPSETVLEKDVNLDNSVIANLSIISSSDLKTNTWKISSGSDDIVKFTSDNGVVLVKSYPVIGSAERMDLVCTFIVTSRGEELKSVNLETPVVKVNNFDN